MRHLYKTVTAALAACMLLPAESQAQGRGSISYDTTTGSTLKNKEGNRYGRGSMQTMSGEYSFMLSSRQDSTGRVTSWMAGVSAAYARLDNSGTAAILNPDNMLNAGISLTHVRPVSKKWSLMLSVGGGIYAPSNYIRLHSVLGNGTAIFIYRISNGMQIGVGGGLTNSYGIPMILPMIYFKWAVRGRYELSVDLTSSIRVAAATRLGKRLRVELVGIDMKGMAAVTDIDGEPKIYSTLTMCSYLRPSIRIGKYTNVCIGIGGNWMRGTNITTRSLKGLFENFKNNDKNKYFGVSARIEAGISYGL